MTYKACVKDGVVVLDEAVRLPEGAILEVHIQSQVKPELEPDPGHSDAELAPGVRSITGILPAEIDLDETRFKLLLQKYS